MRSSPFYREQTDHRKRRLLVIEPNLKNPSDHYWSYCEDICYCSNI
jgi:hypothetical protein